MKNHSFIALMFHIEKAAHSVVLEWFGRDWPEDTGGSYTEWHNGMKECLEILSDLSDTMSDLRCAYWEGVTSVYESVDRQSSVLRLVA